MPEREIAAAAGVTLAADDNGDGIPVVLLHGLTASRRYVVMGSHALQRAGHRVIAYDARGHGASSPAAAPDAYRYADLGADLGAVLDAFELERVLLAGVSMGAHTSLRLALEQPERVAALAIITPGYDPVAHHDEQRLARWDALGEALRSDGIDGFVAAFGSARVPERFRDTIATVMRPPTRCTRCRARARSRTCPRCSRSNVPRSSSPAATRPTPGIRWRSRRPTPSCCRTGASLSSSPARRRWPGRAGGCRS